MDAGFFIFPKCSPFGEGISNAFFYEKEEDICRVYMVIHKLCEFLQSLFCQAFLFFFFNLQGFFNC